MSAMNNRLLRLVFGILILLSCADIADGSEIRIRVDASAEGIETPTTPPLLSLPPEEWARRHQAERFVFVPGETVRLTVEVPEEKAAGGGRIAVVALLSGHERVFHRGPLEPRQYGPYDVPIAGDFEIYRADVWTVKEMASRAFYGIRPARGMKDFAEEVSSFGMALRYAKMSGRTTITKGGARLRTMEATTPWDEAVTEGAVSPRGMDLRWARGSHAEKGTQAGEWWLWTHYACGMLDLQSDRTGLFWGEYNPAFEPIRVAGLRQDDGGAQRTVYLPPWFRLTPTHLMLPNEIYFRERMQPMLREWAEKESEKHPGAPLRISLEGRWGIGQGIGTGCDPETLRFFVSWMKELFGITIEAETFKELLEKCNEYPKHFEYFVTRYTTFRSLELTVQAVQEIVAGSRAWEWYGEWNRRLVALPEAKEFCEILSRCMSVGTDFGGRAFHLTGGNPLPHGLANMIIKTFAPERRLCAEWMIRQYDISEAEILRWCLEPAWLTAYDAKGKLRHVITHSPPKGSEGVWRALDEMGWPAERVRLPGECYQLMEAIGVERPIGPVFVCKDWTFTDDKSGEAWRSDLYETFWASLRRHKVPISCAVHADNEASLPDDIPRVYAPRMNGKGKICFGYRAGSEQESFTCEASAIPESLMSEFAIRLDAACGRPVEFQRQDSIEGYAFEAKGMIFVVVEEMAGRWSPFYMQVKVGDGEWIAIDVIAGQKVGGWRVGEIMALESFLQANGATLLCLARRDGR